MRQSANKEWKHKQQQTPASEEINKNPGAKEKKRNETTKKNELKLEIKSNRIVSTADANQQRQPSNRMRLFVFDLFGNKLNASISLALAGNIVFIIVVVAGKGVQWTQEGYVKMTDRRGST